MKKKTIRELLEALNNPTLITALSELGNSVEVWQAISERRSLSEFINGAEYSSEELEAWMKQNPYTNL